MTSSYSKRMRYRKISSCYLIPRKFLLLLVTTTGTAARSRFWNRFSVKEVPMPEARLDVVIYYLFFAFHNSTGGKIARSIFKKYKDKGIVYGR